MSKNCWYPVLEIPSCEQLKRLHFKDCATKCISLVIILQVTFKPFSCTAKLAHKVCEQAVDTIAAHIIASCLTDAQVSNCFILVGWSTKLGLQLVMY